MIPEEKRIINIIFWSWVKPVNWYTIMGLTYYQKASGLNCGSTEIVKADKNEHGKQRWRCVASDCEKKTFRLEYRYKAYELGIKEPVVEMAINGRGIRDTARVLEINKNTVISTLKKKKTWLCKSIPVSLPLIQPLIWRLG